MFQQNYKHLMKIFEKILHGVKIIYFVEILGKYFQV